MRFLPGLFTDATLGFDQPSYQIAEGDGSVDVCVDISDVPSEGADCNITVYLATSDGVKAGKLQL